MRVGYWIAAVVLVAAAAGLVGVSWIRRGFSARDEPSAIERVIARQMRSWAVPASARALKNPVTLTPEVMGEAREHFADHCATCHANDGSGNISLGQNLYPKAPDMRLDDTQGLSDGEIYSIIQNGIRMTGMPAWGQEGDTEDKDSWGLVHFIRHLKDLTPEELLEMKGLNPKSPHELQEEKEEEEFLRGADVSPNENSAEHHQH